MYRGQGTYIFAIFKELLHNINQRLTFIKIYEYLSNNIFPKCIEITYIQNYTHSMRYLYWHNSIYK